MSSLLTLTLSIVAGLDAERFPWASPAFATVYFGGTLFLLSIIPIGWTLALNPYLETAVRIQSERGSRCDHSDPTASCDIPCRSHCGQPCDLADLRFRRAPVPAAAIAVLFIIPTALEARTLGNELPGYSEYAQRTPYRLLPAFW